MNGIIHKTLETLVFRDEDSIEDFSPNFDDDYSVPESFLQIFGFAFSKEDINYAIEQLQNEKTSFNSEITSNENERKSSLFKFNYYYIYNKLPTLDSKRIKLFTMGNNDCGELGFGYDVEETKYPRQVESLADFNIVNKLDQQLYQCQICYRSNYRRSKKEKCK
ncbi:15198_t:CDS:2 [Gigaspora margarita]|uniref:15198_t:CDS:1 n=1 Tax=Gigaspora margarita TaxID=4874 RepID=A0ABN7W9Q2_GIGMA|nr:15198_t:CDS:2 [Gigaspora margarita]